MASLVKRTYKFTLPDGTTETREYGHWTIQYRDANGKIKRVKGYADKSASKQLMAKIELQQARGEQVMVNPFKAANASAVSEHLADYIRSLESSGRDAMYCYIAKQRIQRVIDETGWTALPDITADSFGRWRDTAKVNPRTVGFRKSTEKKKTASARTLNQYLDTVRAFTNWAAGVKRMPGVPAGDGKMIAIALAGVGKVTGETRRKRRALSDAEVVQLLTAAPADRAFVYRFAVTTGLRRAELEQLAWGDLRLKAINPCIKLRAETTKANRADAVPLPPGLADDLRKMKPKDAAEDDRVFAVPSLYFWKADLAAADIVYVDKMGRAADFHAGTRKTLATRMHKSGVPLAVAMRVMRHTDAKLTLVDYTDDDQLGIADAMAAVSELKGTEKEKAG
jgi:integrase